MGHDEKVKWHRPSWMGRTAASTLIASAAMLAGCAVQSESGGGKAGLQPRDRALAMRTTGGSIAGRSVEGRSIERWTHGTGGDAVLIIATIHGDEAAGTPLVEMLATWLERHPEAAGERRIVIVPVANPDGMAHHRRENMRGVDLNRNFPASNYEEAPGNGGQPLSEPESRALAALIDDVRPSLVISIHQPLRCIDYDGPARAIAEAMAGACELPVRKLGARPGSLGSYVGLELGIPIVTVELPGSASRWSPEKLWNRYGKMLLSAIAS